MKLVWNSTGDWLELDPVNIELAKYWIHSLDQDSINVFHLGKNYFDLNWPNALAEHIRTVDEFLIAKLKITKLSQFVGQDLISQSVLNALHRTWIQLIDDYPNLVRIISCHSDLLYHWNQINKKVHFIEEGFSSEYVAKQHWEVQNIFGTGILNFDCCQIRIAFSQEGRSTYNKWRMRDDNVVDKDTNDFSSIGSEVHISLERSYSGQPPKEYIDFCHYHNLPVIGSRLNLANFTDCEQRLSDIRHVYLRNISYENNTASFRF